MRLRRGSKALRAVQKFKWPSAVQCANGAVQMSLRDVQKFKWPSAVQCAYGAVQGFNRQ